MASLFRKHLVETGFDENIKVFKGRVGDVEVPEAMYLPQAYGAVPKAKASRLEKVGIPRPSKMLKRRRLGKRKSTTPGDEERAAKAEACLNYLVKRRKTPLFDPDSELFDDLSETQQSFLDVFEYRRNVFLTGRAGSGKSKVITALTRAMDAAGTRYAITAASGIAAEHIDGVTLQSSCCLNENMDLATCIQRARRFRFEELATLEVLIIDEISMVSAETMEKVMTIFQAVRGSLPIIVLVGDFAQLPPVNGRRLLDSAVWARLNPVVVLLEGSFRQKDQDFVDILDEARFGSLSDASIEVLEGRIDAMVIQQGVKPTRLVSLVKTAAALNKEELEAIGGERHTYRGSLFVGTKNDEGLWCKEKDCSEELPKLGRGRKQTTIDMPAALENLDVALPAEVSYWFAGADIVRKSAMSATLELAINAQVVFTENVQQPVLNNGTRGVVVSFSPAGLPVVKLLSGTEVTVEPYARTQRVNRHSPMPCYVFRQVPLQLGWALTIHKSQGMNLDCAIIDLGPDVFSQGQGYVALSRLRSLRGLCLTRFDPKSIQADPRVVAWYRAAEARAKEAEAEDADGDSDE